MSVWDSTVASAFRATPQSDLEFFEPVYDSNLELITADGSINEFYIRNVSSATVRYAGHPSCAQELEFCQELRRKLFVRYCYMMDRRNRPRSLDIYSMDELFRIHSLCLLRYFQDQRISHVIMGVPSSGYDLIAAEAIRYSGGKCVFLYQQHYGKFSFGTTLDELHRLRKSDQIFGEVKVDLTDEPGVPHYMESIMGQAEKNKSLRNRVSSVRREIRQQEAYLLGQMSGGRKRRWAKLVHFFVEQADRHKVEHQAILSSNRTMKVNREKSEDVKICLLALQVPGEAANAFADEQWLNPLHQLDKLLTVLPDNWKIWVKPHPKQPRGFRSVLFWETMQLSGRVEVIHPGKPARDFFSELSLVATANGTVGWEAVYRGIPALIFGPTWYQNLPGVIHVDQFQSVGDVPRPESWSVASLVGPLTQKTSQMAPGFVGPDYVKARDMFHNALQKLNPLDGNHETVAKSVISILNKVDQER